MNTIKLAIYHSDCGGVLGYVVSPETQRNSSKDFYFIDGSKPSSGDSLEIHCNKCSKTVTEFSRMTAHIFDEWE